MLTDRKATARRGDVVVSPDHGAVLVLAEPDREPADVDMPATTYATTPLGRLVQLRSGTPVRTVRNPVRRFRLLQETACALADSLGCADATIDGMTAHQAHVEADGYRDRTRTREELIALAQGGKLSRTAVNEVLARLDLIPYEPRIEITYTITGSFTVAEDGQTDDQLGDEIRHCLGHVLEASTCPPSGLITGTERRDVTIDSVRHTTGDDPF